MISMYLSQPKQTRQGSIHALPHLVPRRGRKLACMSGVIDDCLIGATKLRKILVDDITFLAKTCLLLGIEYIDIIFFEPQSVHDSGVQCNHHCQRNKYHDIARQGEILRQPLLGPCIYAEVVVNFHVHEQRGVVYK